MIDRTRRTLLAAAALAGGASLAPSHAVAAARDKARKSAAAGLAHGSVLLHLA